MVRTTKSNQRPAKKKAAARAEFSDVFVALKGMMLKHGSMLEVQKDTKDEIILTGPHMERWNRELWFGGAQIKKNYVSYHLMAVYMYPDLLRGMSPELKARMQGKSCFNFKKVDLALFAELEGLTQASVQRLRREGIL